MRSLHKFGRRFVYSSIQTDRTSLVVPKGQGINGSSVLDLPGAVGSFAPLKQTVSVVSGVSESGCRECTVPDFSLIGDSSTGVMEGFMEAGRATASRKICSFTLPYSPMKNKLVVHLLPTAASHIAYHTTERYFTDSGEPQTRTGVWPQEDYNLNEVRSWSTAIAVNVNSVTQITPSKYMVIGETESVISAEAKYTEPLAVSSILMNEQLLIDAFREKTLLPEDWGHEAKLVLAWWYTRKYGRNRSADILLGGALSYLRKHDAESWFNSTEILALLHLVSHAMYTTGGLVSFSQFIEAVPNLKEHDVLLDYYSPEHLGSRQSRLAFNPPDKKSFEGPSYPSNITKALNEDVSLYARFESPQKISDLELATSLEALPPRPDAVPEGYDTWRVDDSITDTYSPEGKKLGAYRDGKIPYLSK